MTARKNRPTYMRRWRRRRWLERFARELYLLELRWTYTLARSAKRYRRGPLAAA